MNLDKVINLVRKTNDKIIIVNENNNTNLVLMPFSDYEKIINDKNDIRDLDEKEMLAQIDRDISIWKQEHLTDEDEEKNIENQANDLFAEPFDESLPEDSYYESEPEEEFKGEFNNNLELEKKEESNLENKEQVQLKNYENYKNFDDLINEQSLDAKFSNNKTEKKNITNDQQLSSENYRAKPPIKYEDIPPPPDVTASDLFRPEEKPIIDASFEEDEFAEEPVY